MTDFESARLRIIDMAGSDAAHALELADALVHDFPNLSASWSTRSHVLWILGMHRDALIDSDRAIMLQPEEPAYYFHKGDYLLELEAFDDAIELFSKSITMGEDGKFEYYDSSSRMFRAYCYFRNGLFDEALLDLAAIEGDIKIWVGDVLSKNELIRVCLKRKKRRS